MHGRLAGIACALALALAAPAAHADPKQAKAQKPDVPAVDISPVRDKLWVLQSDAGHFIALEQWEIGSDHFYFGDAKNLYRQRSMSGSASGREQFERRFWSPRVNHQGYIELRDGTWTLKCGDRSTVFNEVTGDARARLLEDGAFHDVLWDRQSYALARDKRGRYYYVDRLRDERGSKGFRLFIGQKGNLKDTRLLNIVSDSEGDIFSSKKGELRLIMPRSDDGRTLWIRGKKETELVTVPLWKNLVLIYQELGVYAGQALGTPCDFY